MKKPVSLSISSHCYTITMHTNHGLPLLRNHKYFNLMFDCLTIISKKYKLNLLGYVFLPNGIKIVTCGLPQTRLTNFVETLKNLSRQELIRFLEEDGKKDLLNQIKMGSNARKHKVWATNFESTHLKSYNDLEQSLNELHVLPLRNGLVFNPESYKYSSSSYYKKGKHGGLRITDYRQVFNKPEMAVS
ncbi:hypothetical protein R9C00_13405 [Flammeovirgaceae bacterium SG7u.111]|nr:hypothetical protein [Flammeovirgaceae bacterium SG7u.132]WPO38454.1 hypothetical protein R9C00_13405 [Flammeovirgaceae bacterium SG7u.111]